MGQLLDRLSKPLEQCRGSLNGILGRTHKRKRSTDADAILLDELYRNEMQPAKKKKLLTTTEYIYKALFKEGSNSNIAVMALGKVWKLHKIYLCQSPYFFSMFNGPWKESCQKLVHIKMSDNRITRTALDAVFGSMYSDEIVIDPQEVIPILATAALFQLDSIIAKCTEVMIENINAQTAIMFYEASCQYGTVAVKKATFEWLQINLLSAYSKNLKPLREIGVDLMTDLVASADLFVMQTEYSLYCLLRNWVYLVLHPDYEPDQPSNGQQQQQQQQQQRRQTPPTPPPTSSSLSLLQPQQRHDEEDELLVMYESEPSSSSTSPSSSLSSSLSSSSFPVAAAADADNNGISIVQTFFINCSHENGGRSFLSTPVGQQFIRPFQMLRTQFLTNHHLDFAIVLKENILPRQWLHHHLLSHWRSILKIDHCAPESLSNVDNNVFLNNCMRCSRILNNASYQKWRWTGFNFGLDLILISDARVLSIRRHHRHEHERLLSFKAKRNFMIRVLVTSAVSREQPAHIQKSEILTLSLERNEESTLMIIDDNIIHPLLISVNILAIPPTSQTFKQSLLQRNNNNTGNNASVAISNIGASFIENCTPAAEDASPDAAAASLPHSISASSVEMSSSSAAAAAAAASVAAPLTSS